MAKRMRELVEEELRSRHDWANKAIHYDDPQELPNLMLLTDEEVWELFMQHAGGAAVG